MIRETYVQYVAAVYGLAWVVTLAYVVDPELEARPARA